MADTLTGAELAAEVARCLWGWTFSKCENINHDAYKSGQYYDSEGIPVCKGDDFRPDLDANHLREVLAEIERRGRWSQWSGIMLVQMAESNRDWRDQRSVAWYVATADPALACRAAIEAVEGDDD